MGRLRGQVYIISDLHIGGAPPDPSHPGSRGFRMMTHPEELADMIAGLAGRPHEPQVELVINGDFVDFLAEEHSTDPPAWMPFVSDPDHAQQILRRIAARNQPIFSALGALLAAGHRLTILLGNHDIELSFPAVRRTLEEILQVKGTHDLCFIYDGEAYTAGDALIEHGNRYDRFNQVDYNGLRQLRSLQSRKQTGDAKFSPPAGSRLVAEVMNPIKEKYSFVDLLKPEVEAVLPTLLALEPAYRSKITEIVKVLGPAYMRTPEDARGKASPAAGESLQTTLTGGMDPAEGTQFLKELEAPEAEGGILEQLGLYRDHLKQWAKGRDHALRDRRLRALNKALRKLQNDQTFNDAVETGPEYLSAAEDLTAQGSFRYVIFGHTHLAKKVALKTGGIYLNTGTWCDLMKVPAPILRGNIHEALAEVEIFMTKLQQGDLSGWVFFRPTYVRLDLGRGGRVVDANLCEFGGDSL